MAQHRRTSLPSANRRLPATEAHSKSDWLKVTVRPSLPHTDSDASRARTPHSARVDGRGERPPLFALLEAPQRVAEVSLEEIPGLVAEVASERAALSAIQGAL